MVRCSSDVIVVLLVSAFVTETTFRPFSGRFGELSKLDGLCAGFGRPANGGAFGSDEFVDGTARWVMGFRTSLVPLTESFKSVRKRMKVIMKRFGLFILFSVRMNRKTEILQ